MKEKIIQLLLKYIPVLAKKIWPHLKDSLVDNKTPNIVTFRDEPNNNSVILFVHGFSGEAETTFGNTAIFLGEENRIKGWNMFSIGYSSNQMPSLGIGIWAAIPDIAKISSFLITTIRSEFKKYNRIAIVAHSMGGLVVQKAILEMDDEYRSKIKYVLLFGTPSNGLAKAAFLKFWNRQLRDMSNKGKFITNLREQWSKIFQAGYPFVLKVVAGTDDEFVPVFSSQSPFNYDKKFCEVVSGNHLTIVKPENKNHAGYQLILATLSDSEFIDVYTDMEAVNLLLGNYVAVVNELLLAKNNLDKNGIVKLIFALEGLGRNAEALAILESSPVASNNSDLLGILGGRYKRKYLNGYETASAEKSLEYYQKALDISKNNEQIFYHSINIAFLNLIYKEDKDAMKKYAQKALGAANNSSVDCWQKATIAEANMYLENMEAARKYYEEAGAAAGVREKISMYANAFMGYTTLKHIESGQDDFILFLKQKLLS